MGYVIVKYPETRDVNIDDDLNGQTNDVLRVDDGTHVFDLGQPQDYEPAEQEVVVTGTDILIPMEITFTRKV